MKKPVKITLIVLVVVLVIGVAIVGGGAFWFRQEQPQMFADPVFEHTPPTISESITSPAVLVFSKTAGFRHKEAIVAANKVFTELAAKNGWSIFFTENAAVFNPKQLALFDVVVGSNTTGSALIDDQRNAFQAYLEAGGGYVGLHGAGDDSHAVWPWYQQEVIRAKFIGHTLFPQDQFQVAEVTTEDGEHPAMGHLPKTWDHEEEWYSFEQSPRERVTVLATVDENSYKPGRVAMGDDHPIIWSHTLGEGRIFYSSLGHQEKAYLNPEYQILLQEAVVWVGRL